MQFGNREKIVIGSIAGLVTVAALHMLVFKSNADELASQQNEYNNKKTAIEQLGQPKDLPAIQKFQLGNANYLLQYYEILKDLNLLVPDYYTTKHDLDKQKAKFQDYLKTLLSYRKPDVKPKMTFLDSEQWDLPEKMPESITTSGKDIGDMIRQVVDADKVLDVLPAQSPLRNQQDIQYKALLKEIGMDMEKYANLPKFGEPVKTFYTLVRIRLISDALPKEYELKNKEATLGKLLRLEWPKQILYPAKQMEALNDLIGIAQKAEIEEIASVTLLPTMAIYPPEEIKSTQPADGGAGQQPGAGRYGEFAPQPGGPGRMMNPDGEPMPGGFSPEGGVPYNPEGGGPGPGFAYGQYGVAEQQAPPTAKVLGSATPIKLEMIGPNLNVMKFLYEVTHSRRPYEIEDLAIKSVEQQAGWIRIITTINVISTAGTKIFTPEEADSEIKKWKDKQQELMQKLGLKNPTEKTEVEAKPNRPT